jgi:hypothetical protein
VRHDTPLNGFLSQFPRRPVAHWALRGRRRLAGQGHDLHDLFRGEDPRRSGAGRIGQQGAHQVGEFTVVVASGRNGGQGRLGLRPTLTPAAHGLAGQVEALCDLLVPVLGGGSGQHDLGAPDLPLGAGLTADDACEDGLLARGDDDRERRRAGPGSWDAPEAVGAWFLKVHLQYATNRLSSSAVVY